jgi:HEPN domain-containing protein
MTNEKLALDYITRAHGRRVGIQANFNAGLFADVVRQSQESVELALKALVRWSGHEVPHSHEISKKLESICNDLPDDLRTFVPRFAAISKKMRRDRELSFYGSEDITPSEFYDRASAETAMAELEEVLTALPPVRFV